MSFVPIPCPPASGTGGGADVEQLVLCDVDAQGEVVGTALAVYEYDSDGNPVGAPTFVDPISGDPYVAQGTLMPCPGEVGCLAPVQFCFTSTSTGPVDHPGRQYDITLPINPGFAVQSLQVDAVNSAANIVWDVADPDGEQFRQDLTTFIEARIPAAAVVTITNPNAGNVICGTAQPMQIHIECLRLDQNPPNLIELIYNGGEDLILNPAYNETPPLNPPVSQGNYGFHLLSRQDDPGPFPGNQPSNDANCTNVANRGWETNDVGRTFEIWGQDIVNGSNVTPTPRGTPVQEMTSDGPPPGGISTIWQTFQAPANANFIVRVVHGARDAGETHRITLDNGDTNDAQNGDLIDDITNPAVVTNSPGGPSPWTTFNQTIPLTGGNIYTLALSSTNPVLFNRGGLFTDMRAYIDRPDLRATAATDDDTCVVTVDETTTNTDCQYWSPRCINGEVISWRNVETGEELANAAFWGQAPAPDCCLPQAAEGEGGSVAANLVHNYEICGIVGGVPTTLNRVVVTDASGGTLLDQIIGPDGAPVAPASYTIGACTADRYVNDEILCDDNGPFLRKYIQSLNATGQGQINSFRDFTLTGGGYAAVGVVRNCGDLHIQDVVLCDGGNGGQTFIRKFVQQLGAGNVPSTLSAVDFEADGTTPYVPVGPIQDCAISAAFIDNSNDTEQEILCDDNGPFIRTYRYDSTGVFVTTGDLTLAGAGYAAVGTVSNCPVDVVIDNQLDIEEHILCDSGNANFNFIRRFTFDADTGVNVATADLNLDGTPYVGFVGPAVRCADEVTIDNQLDVEEEVLCDDNGPFIRRFVFDADTGAVTATNDVTLAGAPYVVVGAVVVCPTTSIDTEVRILCDDGASDTQFLRNYTYVNGTGPITVDTELDGTTPYVVVGDAVECSNCCPIVVANVCLSNGNPGVVIRNPDGTLAYTDTVTGLAFNPATDIVDCPAPEPATAIIDSTVQRQTGAGNIVIAAGARSVSVVVITGTVTVDLGQGVTTLPSGSSFTWAGDTIGESLTESFTFTGIAGSDFIVTSTREL